MLYVYAWVDNERCFPAVERLLLLSRLSRGLEATSAAVTVDDADADAESHTLASVTRGRERSRGDKWTD